MSRLPSRPGAGPTGVDTVVGGDPTPTTDDAAPVPTWDPSSDRGRRVSRYVVIEELGRGGMGRVLRAYDPKLRREVALKEVRRDLLDREATRRLAAEARAMAKLSHPNVVAIYDAEERASGELVLAMEYVQGQTLRRWLRAKRRASSEIVEKFVAAGRGLEVAHAAGLLHRDFKPANVLVGDDGTVKVTDFGLAKLSEDASSTAGSVEGDGDERTRSSVETGTPRYMAPEQYRGERLTAAVDQYALCLALWEALCGRPPFEGSTMAADKEAGPPKWPQRSTPRWVVEAIERGLAPRPEDRWPSMTALLEALAHSPSRRRRWWLVSAGVAGTLGLAQLWSEARTDARQQRCQGASGLLAGIWDAGRREQVREAIVGVDKPYATAVWDRTARELDAYASQWAAMHTQACEATTIHHEQSPRVLDLRMACLQRAAQGLEVTIDTLCDADEDVVRHTHELLQGLAPLSRCSDVDALRSEVEPPRPSEVEAVKAIQAELVRAAQLRRAGRYRPAFEAVARARTLLGGVSYPRVRVDTLLEEGRIHQSLGDYEASIDARLEALELALQFTAWEQVQAASQHLMFSLGARLRRTEEALGYRFLAFGLLPSDGSAGADYRQSLGAVFDAAGRPADAEREFRRAISIREESSVDEPIALAKHRWALATVLADQARYEEAEAQFTSALSQLEGQLGPGHPEVAACRSALGNLLYDRGDYERAEAEHGRALSARESALGSAHVELAESHYNLANALGAQGRHGDAEEHYRVALAQWEQTLPDGHPTLAKAHSALGWSLFRRGARPEAETHLRTAVEIAEAALGPEHLDVANPHNNLAVILNSLGRGEEAQQHARAALRIWEASLGSEHPLVARAHANLGNIFEKQYRLDEAESELRAAMAIRDKSLPEDHPTRASTHNGLGNVLLAKGDYVGAQREYEAALTIWRRALGSEHDSLAAVRDNLGLALRGQGAYREAEVEHRAALTLRERLFGDDDPRVALTRNNLAHLLLLRGQLREARRLAERARQRCQHEDVSSDQRVNNAFVLARVLWRTGGRSQQVRALDLAKEALRGYQQLGNEREVEALEAWLESRRGHDG